MSFEAVKSDVPELLTWFQDVNWPVTKGIAEFLIPHLNEVTNDLIEILNSDDDPWKWGILVVLIENTQKKIAPELLSVIKSIVINPTESEKDNDVDIASKRIVELNNSNNL